MKELFVPYEMAVELQTLGFNEPCICGFDKEGRLRSKLAHSNDTGVRIDWDKHDDHIPAPLWQQVTDWLRKTHKINVFLGFRLNTKKWDSHAYKMNLTGEDYAKERSVEKVRNSRLYDDPNDALIVGIKEALTKISQ